MIVWLIGLVAVISALAAVWLVPLYFKLISNEKQIRTKEDEIDAVEPEIYSRTAGHLVNDKQTKAMIESAKKPFLRDLERLKQERQFIIDKLPFFRK